MADSAEWVALTELVATRMRMSATLRDLRRRLYLEYLRFERERLLRVRHYLTVGSLSQPVWAHWMNLWHHGNDLNLINMTSLSHRSFMLLMESFSLFYIISTHYPKGGRQRKLQKIH
ncbi:uncharacterized protein PITG_15063 [Phytophthora infestans T30-4]|uniref:Uncharacterized protein n=1 Tax=Phytophthora infestans (strain T30-4) TaxID=403677 RepID=D0NRK3_PHYIT|nr:uncharacterized protein PITG_15063 [Phytophthora infestans T30-4]EEY63353.1 conserved hypothetical protein [Phytophthora infestans T30-4]KAI9982439.1 hypothetical protein PInf_008382 [Phytophthora infestans]|eukprot:XP_002898238.1 conserved hypothetical protein [Phytophthora infestans T30-4]